MIDLTIDQLLKLTFNIRKEPVLRPFGGAVVVADPSLLTPDQAPDKKWHMFFHTTFGVYHFCSPDGICFSKAQKIASNAMRPDVNRIGDRYYLFYEKTRSLAGNALTLLNLIKWKSSISVRSSSDLMHWSEPKTVIASAGGYEDGPRGSSISNPFLIEENGRYRLYFSCGLTYIKDCGFCEPTYISYAESQSIDEGYVVASRPIISPDKKIPYLNLCSGCLKVYRLKDGFIGIQNGIYEESGASRSAIVLLTSKDGLHFEFVKVLVRPDLENPSSWMRQFVYASHLVRYGNVLRLYFNGRDTADMLKGRECIGFAEAVIPEDK